MNNEIVNIINIFYEIVNLINRQKALNAAEEEENQVLEFFFNSSEEVKEKIIKKMNIFPSEEVKLALEKLKNISLEEFKQVMKLDKVFIKNYVSLHNSVSAGAC